MKRIFALFLVLVSMVSCMVVAGAEDDITVTVNGSVVEFDVPPQIIKGRTMVPMRKVFEALGARIEWIAEMQLVIATYKTTVISMRINADNFTVTDVLNGENATKNLDVPAQIIDGRTLIPLRAVSEALGKTVEWDGSTRTAIITD